MSDHVRFMQRALALAEVAMLAGEPPFAAIVVDQGGNEVVATHDRVNTLADMTAHAEVLAVREACGKLGADLGGCTLYTTCEPCPMCYTAAWLARVEAIVYAATMDEVHALLGDAQRELRVSVERMNALTDEPLALVSGVCRDSSLALFERWARNAA